MMKKLLSIYLTLSLIIIGCSKPTYSYEEEMISKSNHIIDQLQRLNWEEFSKYVHPEKGLHFTFYANVNYNNILFSSHEIAKFGDEQNDFIWGYDLSDVAFEMTPNEWVENYLFKYLGGRPLTYTEITFNDSVAPRGGMINNIHEFYPDSYYVEFFSPPTELELDWQAIRFIFEYEQNEWFLTAIVRDVYSP